MKVHIKYAVSLKLTFAGCHALKPLVINIFVGTSAVVKPSTTWSTTTASARFLERATFSTRYRFSDRLGDSWCADWRGN